MFAASVRGRILLTTTNCPSVCPPLCFSAPVHRHTHLKRHVTLKGQTRDPKLESCLCQF